MWILWNIRLWKWCKHQPEPINKAKEAAILWNFAIQIDLIGWLVGFFGISTFVDYLMPNPFFIQMISSMSNKAV